MKAGWKRLMPYLMGFALLGLVACDAGGVTDEDANAIREDLDTVQQRLDEIEDQMSSLEAGDADEEEVATAVREAVEDARAETQEAQENLEPPQDPAADGGLDGGAGDPLAPEGDGMEQTDPNAPAF